MYGGASDVSPQCHSERSVAKSNCVAVRGYNPKQNLRGGARIIQLSIKSRSRCWRIALRVRLRALPYAQDDTVNVTVQLNELVAVYEIDPDAGASP